MPIAGTFARIGDGMAEKGCRHQPPGADLLMQALGASEVDNAAVFDISQKKNSRGILQCMASAALALGLERRRAPVSTVLWFWVFACALTGQTDVTTLTDVLSYSLLQK